MLQDTCKLFKTIQILKSRKLILKYTHFFAYSTLYVKMVQVRGKNYCCSLHCVQSYYANHLFERKMKNIRRTALKFLDIILE